MWVGLTYTQSVYTVSSCSRFSKVFVWVCQGSKNWVRIVSHSTTKLFWVVFYSLNLGKLYSCIIANFQNKDTRRHWLKRITYVYLLLFPNLSTRHYTKGLKNWPVTIIPILPRKCGAYSVLCCNALLNLNTFFFKKEKDFLIDTGFSIFI